MRIVSALVVCVFLLLTIAPIATQAQSLQDADHVIMRLRPVCHFGQGAALVIAFEIKARSGGQPQRVGGYSITLTYPSSKMLLQGVSQMYNTNYWPGGTWYINQAFGANAWFVQHATQFGSPGSALPLNSTYWSMATDCQSPAQLLGDGFYEILRFNFQIGASASGTANFQMFNVQPYKSGIAFQHGTESSGIYYADLQNNGNDSTLIINNLIVPINLSLFEAAAIDDGSAKLYWRTETETSNAGFAIERGDGEHFETIAFVKARGGETVRTDYEYRDPDAKGVARNGTVFYRLKQIDNDGTSAYSHITSVTFLPETVGFGQNYPNPSIAGASTVIPVNFAVPGTLDLAVYDALGRRVATLANGESRAAGRHEIAWNGMTDAGALAPVGSYFVRLSANLGNGQIVNAVRQVSIVR
jgi:hypothetical protein